MRQVLSYISQFLLLVIIQVLILNNIQFLDFINPYLYVLFIIVLPVNIPRILLLFIAFFLGLSIDVFCNTLGMHAFATIFVAFMKDPILKLFTKDNSDFLIPNMRYIGAIQFVKYAILMVLIHHIVLFGVEAFSFSYPGLLLLKVIANSIFTLILLLSIEYFKLGRK